MMTKKMLCRFMSLLLAFVLILNAGEAFTVRSFAAEEKTTKEYFAYRVDVLDARKGSNDNLAVQLMSSIDGKAYVYVMYNGEKEPAVKTIMGNGNSVIMTAGEETEVYGHIYSSKSIKAGQKYDIYIVFEDPAHVTYGPYVVKKWVAKYFPEGKGTKKNPYQIWTPRHLYNMYKFTGKDNKGKYFRVMQDIDLSESIYSGRIADYASTFYGVFDGGGKTIRGLKGIMFDVLDSAAIVKNIYLADADATRAAVTGGLDGLIAESNKGIIENCVVYNSELESSSYQGIICGFNHEFGIIRNCASVDCTIYANDCAGGIVGRNEGKVKSCYSNISIKSNSSAGGIVGINFGGTVSGSLGTITVIPKGATPNKGQNIGGIVGVQAGSDAFIEDCTSLFLPGDLNDLGNVGSIWGATNGGGDKYLENATGNVGAVKYSIEDITLTEKEIGNSTNESYLIEKLEKKRTSFVSHHGASSDTRKVKNPVEKTIEGGNPDGKNKAGISYLDIAYSHIYENETEAYNAKDKYPMTQQELTVKKYSTPGRVKIKKIKVDSKNGQATLIWSTVKKAEGYEIYRAKWHYADKGGKYGAYELYKKADSANATDYTDKYLYEKYIYYYRIRAYYTVNGVKVYGPLSEIKEVEIVKD